MDVFLIPDGRSSYHLYCEVDEEAHQVASADEHRGWRRRAVDLFTKIVAKVDHARHAAMERRARRVSRGFVRRVNDRVICWLAEKVAEQRVLWHLRRQTEVTAWFPDDMDEAAADKHIKDILRRDAQRHGRWAILHAILAPLSLLVMPIPGPNLLGYYFVFRLVGHYLSRTGARHGLECVTWHLKPSPALTELRQAIALEPDRRRQRIADIASRLRLEHLPAFLERLALPVR